MEFCQHWGNGRHDQGDEHVAKGEAAFFKFDEIDWVDERAQPNPANEEMIAKAEALGAKRKFMSRGQAGFYTEYSYMPPGFVVPPHRHDFDEIFVILDGGCEMRVGVDDAVSLRRNDSVAMSAKRTYGFEVGPDGMSFMVIRPGEATSDFD